MRSFSRLMEKRNNFQKRVVLPRWFWYKRCSETHRRAKGKKGKKDNV